LFGFVSFFFSCYRGEENVAEIREKKRKQKKKTKNPATLSRLTPRE
jgi:hypothetical protein